MPARCLPNNAQIFSINGLIDRREVAGMTRSKTWKKRPSWIRAIRAFSATSLFSTICCAAMTRNKLSSIARLRPIRPTPPTFK